MGGGGEILSSKHVGNVPACFLTSQLQAPGKSMPPGLSQVFQYVTVMTRNPVPRMPVTTSSPARQSFRIVPESRFSRSSSKSRLLFMRYQTSQPAHPKKSRGPEPRVTSLAGGDNSPEKKNLVRLATSHPGGCLPRAAKSNLKDRRLQMTYESPLTRR